MLENVQVLQNRTEVGRAGGEWNLTRRENLERGSISFEKRTYKAHA